MIDAEIQNGHITKRYIFINLRAVALIEYENNYENNSAKIYAIHTDHLGTPLAITDSSQAVVWRSEYATFGKATVQARVVENSKQTASNGIISSANASEGAASGTKAANPLNLTYALQGSMKTPRAVIITTGTDTMTPVRAGI